MKNRPCTCLSLLALALGISSCSFFQFSVSKYEDAGTFEKRTFALKNYNEEYQIKSKSIDLYFKDGGALPYVELHSFVSALEGLYQTSYISFKTVRERELDLTWRTSEATYQMRVDDQSNSIWVSSLDFFNLIYSTSGTDYNFSLKVTDAKSNPGNPVIFDLGTYGIDIFRKKDEVLLPFCIANTLFCSSHYTNLYYNGTAVYNAYFSFAMDEEAMKGAYSENRTFGQAIPEDVAKMNKAGFLFVLNRYYGLRDDLREGFAPEAVASLASRNDETAFSAMTDILYNQLDEMHTSYDSLSFYASPDGDYSLPVGPRRKAFQEESKELEASYKAAYPEDEPLRFQGDTAIIVSQYPIVTGSSSELKDPQGNLKEDAYLKDSFYYMKEMLSRIEKHGRIKNILLDLTRNGGGNLGAAFRMMGLLTDEKIAYGSTNRLDGSSYCQRMKVDVDEDGDYSDEDSYSSYEWGFLTSGVTFSAANLLACASRRAGIARVFGENSGGGACPIYAFVNADGSSFHISGPSSMATVSFSKGSPVYAGVQGGAGVDKELDRSYFYGHDDVLDALFD